MNIEELLSQRINMSQIKGLVSWASGDREKLCQLWSMAGSDDRRTSVNSLWIMTHLPVSDKPWLSTLRDSMIDMLLVETDPGKKRMLLQLLREQEFEADDIPTDFLDFCMRKINSECEPYAVRCFSIYAAFKMCRHYPELIAELESHLEMLSYQTLSPGLRSVLRQTRKNLRTLKQSAPKC